MIFWHLGAIVWVASFAYWIRDAGLIYSIYQSEIGLCGTRRVALLAFSSPPRGRPGWTCQHGGIFGAIGTSTNYTKRMGPALTSASNRAAV